ncbi:ribonucleoside-diphosphate reductase beta chain [Mycoplasmoides fastidiosum]|uniref:Ribonucleoside-diphosphate reductase subunit beta n=1 Tax=Mycoplasmoides fastidiosum TaxID=92758 RepID=A0ABU0LYI6_9BACT|nr:class 1b ribonucleoside-diphosphate reductase subunit beta [Mycoplasmoides fastidiosum]MDQ0513753.1 ribonucleoside-diphosphate reductase beta chain [Mycoplasmoides fastidiosum]UUD37826.1 class 1b ribonucleoside-diphosphate reductase subunit beta [Mycoplasmoides fastidiosum]
MKNKLKAVNWNQMEDEYSKIFWDQNVRQFWVDEEIPLSSDKLQWETKLNKDEQDLYEKVLSGLTLLDTYQGAVGMTNLSLNLTNLHSKATVQFMGMMEQMHAKSYSSIFSTLSSSERIDQLFKWVENEPALQKKLGIVLSYYENIHNDEDLYMAMVASVFLESFLFYSGFFYPLYLAGSGLMMSSAEIINLIVRDEAIHGLYIGLLASKKFKEFDEKTQGELQFRVIHLLEELMEVEREYTKNLYDKVGLTEQVLTYVEYNANKAMQNLGFDSQYTTVQEDVNPIVLNGINTGTKNHDFFSTKGNGYIKSTKIEEIRDEDFEF